MFALPSLTLARSSSMPLTEAMASSSGITTCEVISSGLAPGSWTRTNTTAGSVRGNRSTPRSRKLKIPITVRKRIIMDAKTGR